MYHGTFVNGQWAGSAFNSEGFNHLFLLHFLLVKEFSEDSLQLELHNPLEK